jgi:Protein of unknown function (DUF3616)
MLPGSKFAIGLPSALVLGMGVAWSALADPVAFDYRGMCDASAAVALDADHFVVADDETNTLFIYRRGEPKWVHEVDLTEELDAPPDKEVDLEAAARIGDRIYWIASHGKDQKRRRRFFATKILEIPKPGLAKPKSVSKDLVGDLIEAPELKDYELEKAAKKDDAEAWGALNIEGLAATPDGDLLIGFRNPIPKGKALIVPLKNPDDMLKGKKAKFGTPIELDLEGNGIRSIERVGSDYLIAAGAYNDCNCFALHRWSGPGSDKTVKLDEELGGLRPEVLFEIPGTDKIQILSDDGGVPVDGVACKDLREKGMPEKMGFRSRVLTLN